MRDPTTESRANGRTRWRRFGLLFGPAMGLVVTVMALMMTGVLALPISIAGTTFAIHVDKLVPHAGTQPFNTKDWTNNTTTVTAGFAQWGDADFVNGAQTPVLVTVLPGGADLGSLTQCVPVGPGHMTITASDADATNGLVVDLEGMTIGSDQTATFNGLQMGIPLQTRAGTYSFGQVASSLSIPAGGTAQSVNQSAVYVQAGTFALKGLSLALGLGSC